MKQICHFLLILTLIVFINTSFGQQVYLNLFATGFSDPVDIANAGDSRLFIVEQAGKIKIIDEGGNVNPVPFLDITSIVIDGGERGLLGLAFHPDYINNGYFYINYTSQSTGGDTQISRFKVSSGNPDIAEPGSELHILTIAQPFGNHNGGDLDFGPDGYLYIGMGDGGSGGDPGNRAQNPLEMLGKMLRIDIDNGSPYSIPATNPFVGDPTTLDEIWALGLRNPWRFSFDSQTGDMWIADVGQNAWEEIDFQSATSSGGENYGWRCYEGSHPFNTSGCPPASAFVFPIYEYSQSGSPGGCSVTGGVVYRGSQYPALDGHYFLSDYCGGWIMTIYYNGISWVTINHGTWSGEGFSTFGEDVTGEVYVAGLFTGKIWKIEEIINSVIDKDNNIVSSIFPNPFKESTTIKFEYDATNTYKLNIYDVYGKLVFTVDNITQGEISLNRDDMVNGIYFFEIRTNRVISGKGKLIVR
ncbi:MAG: cadherin [Bacteroidetes bacterium]|nr:cadherin [Bacteroidota bacterium]